MLEFVNRKASNLNRKNFEVERVEKDSQGNIIRIIGTFIRSDQAKIEGTKVNNKDLTPISNKFINREAHNLNRKIFDIDKIERDYNGNITAIIGSFIRDDNPIVEGSPMDAKTLTFALNKYYFNDNSITIKQGKKERIIIETEDEVKVEINNKNNSIFKVSSSISSNLVTLTIDLSSTISLSNIGKFYFFVTLISKETENILGIEEFIVNIIA